MKVNKIRFFFFFFAFFIYIPQAQSTIIVDGAGEDIIIDGNPEVEVNFNPEFGILSLTRSFYTTATESFNPIYLVNPGEGFDGVVDILFDMANNPLFERCSGSLLSTGKHVLTAAHCLTNNQGKINVTRAEVNFDTSSGRITFEVFPNKIYVLPGWDGINANGKDMAILELNTHVPEEIDRYDIYRGSDEINQVGVKVGYGRSGNGNQGDILETGVKRVGRNRYDGDGSFRNSLFGGATKGILGYDFDNGRPSNDAFRFFFNRPNLGLGKQEVGAAPGDSGSPTFIDGKIAGVTSFGDSFFFVDNETGSTQGSDVDLHLNSSFGEFMYDNRVSRHVGWINEITGIPEPSTGLVCLIGAAFIQWLRISHKKLI